MRMLRDWHSIIFNWHCEVKQRARVGTKESKRHTHTHCDANEKQWSRRHDTFLLLKMIKRHKKYLWAQQIVTIVATCQSLQEYRRGWNNMKQAHASWVASCIMIQRVASWDFPKKWTDGVPCPYTVRLRASRKRMPSRGTKFLSVWAERRKGRCWKSAVLLWTFWTRFYRHGSS